MIVLCVLVLVVLWLLREKSSGSHYKRLIKG